MAGTDFRVNCIHRWSHPALSQQSQLLLVGCCEQYFILQHPTISKRYQWSTIATTYLSCIVHLPKKCGSVGTGLVFKFLKMFHLLYEDIFTQQHRGESPKNVTGLCSIHAMKNSGCSKGKTEGGVLTSILVPKVAFYCSFTNSEPFLFFSIFIRTK